MRSFRIAFLCSLALLALVPAVVTAGGKGQNHDREHDRHGASLDDHDRRDGPPGHFTRDEKREQNTQKHDERREALEKRLHELHCRVLQRHWPAKWERQCAGEEPDPKRPGPDSEPESPPAPEPTGVASFVGATVAGGVVSSNAGPELMLSTAPGAEFSWSDGTFRLTFSRFAGTFTMTGVNGTSLSRSIAAECGAWDTLQVAIFHADGMTTELRNVALGGTSLGDLVDNGDGVPENAFWTFAGLSLDGGFELTADLVVTGWATASEQPARVEFTVGCGA